MQQLNEQQQIQQMQTILTLQQSLIKQQLMSANHKLSLVQSALDRLRKEQTMKRFHVEKKVFPAMQVAATFFLPMLTSISSGCRCMRLL